MTASGWNCPTTGGENRPHPFADNSRGPRLHRVLAEAGVASRRACEELILSGAVSVNGIVVDTLPAWVDPASDRITVNERLVRREAPVYVIYFKPRGVLSTNAQEEKRRRAIDVVQHPTRARLYPVGRLDAESSGLLLMTNDGELAHRLTHPRFGVHKTYEVTVDGTLDDKSIERLSRGVFLPEHRRGRRGGRTKRSTIQRLRSSRDRTKLLVELTEGRNRQIRRMLVNSGHPVRRLRRVRFGPLELKGLRPGDWRDLQPEEVAKLWHAVGGKDAVSGKEKQNRPAKPARSRGSA